jgi:hypothetical protein
VEAELRIDPSVFQRLTRLRAVVDQDALQNLGPVRKWKQAFGEKLREAAIAAFSGEQLPGMTAPVDSERMQAALGDVQLTRNAVVIPIMDINESQRLLHSLETGTDELDLKPFILARGARTSRIGTRYKIIPLGHDVDATSSHPLGERLDRFEAATGQRALPRSRGIHRRYRNPTTGQPHATGLVERMKRDTPTSGTTFRTVSTASPEGSWVVRKRPPNPVREAIVNAALADMTP